MRKNTLFQKTGAVALSVVLALTMSAAPQGVKAEESGLPAPVVHFDFEEEPLDGVFHGEGAVASMVNTCAVEQQTVRGTVTGVVRFDRASEGYLQLLDEAGTDTFSQLDGKEAVTVTFWEKAYDSSTSWPFFAMQNGTSASNRKYIGIISKQDNVRVEKQNGRNTGTSCSAASGWRHVAYVYDAAGGRVYINGQFAGSVTEGTALTEILQTNPVTFLGYASWGEYSNLAMDEFKVYDTALSEEQITADYESDIAGIPAPSVQSVDEAVGTAEGTVLHVKTGTTAAVLKEALVTDPAGAAIVVYTGSDKTEEAAEDALVEQGYVVEITADGLSGEYTVDLIMEKTETTGEETETTKTFLLGPEDVLRITESAENQNTGYEKDGRYGNDAASMGAWGAQARLYLPADNLANLQWVKATVRTTSYTKGDARIGIRFLVGEEAVEPVLTPYFSNTETNVPYDTYELYNKENETELDASAFQKAYLLWHGTWNNKGSLNTTYSSGAVRDITLQYAKTSADLALDEAIEAAKKVQSPDSVLQEALYAAEQLKPSTAENPFTAATATQVQIQQAADTLQDIIRGDVKDAVVTSVDSAAGVLLDHAITAEYKTTAAGLKEAVVTDPEAAEVIIYADESEAAQVEDAALLSDGNVLVVSSAGRNSTSYIITVKPRPENTVIETMAQEDENTKTIVFAGRDLVQNFGNQTGQNGLDAAIDEEYYMDGIGSMSGWTTRAWLYLPEDSVPYLTSAEVSVRDSYHTDGQNYLELRFVDEAGDETAARSRITVNDFGDYTAAVLYDAAEDQIDRANMKSSYLLFYGNKAPSGSSVQGAKGSCLIKTMTLTYEKSEADKALDAAIAAAEQVQDPGAVLSDALAYAKTLKISTASDVLTAAIASQAQIQGAAEALTQLIETPALEKGDLTMDNSVTVNDVLLALEIASGKRDSNDMYITVGDFNGDRQITAVDAWLLLKKVNTK